MQQVYCPQEGSIRRFGGSKNFINDHKGTALLDSLEPVNRPEEQKKLISMKLVKKTIDKKTMENQ